MNSYEEPRVTKFTFNLLNRVLNSQPKNSEEKEEFQKLNNFFNKPEACDILLTENKLTLLHLAALYNDVKTVKYLLDKGANPNIPDNDQQLPIHLTYNFQIIKLLIKKCPFMINRQNCVGLTALHIAIKNKNYETMKYLLAKNADPNIKTIFDQDAWNYAKSSLAATAILEEYTQKQKNIKKCKNSVLE